MSGIEDDALYTPIFGNKKINTIPIFGNDIVIRFDDRSNFYEIIEKYDHEIHTINIPFERDTPKKQKKPKKYKKKYNTLN